jgi:uncharacterized membrane protein
VDQVTAFVGQPGFAAGLGLVVAGWIAANLAGGRLGGAVDPPPFAWLQGAATTMALFVAVLILTTQRRENLLAGQREQLILELSVLNEQKVSKIIELIEEVRRDNPAIRDRIDAQADAMSTPQDSLAVMGAIKDAQDEPARGAEPREDRT